MRNTLSFSVGGFIAIALLAVAIAVTTAQQDAGAAFYNSSLPLTATTSTAVAVTSSTRLLATTTYPVGQTYTRLYATICNPNANPVFVSMNGDIAASKSSATVVLAAAAGYSVCYEITDRNTYLGSITASSTNETSTSVLVQEFVR